MEERKIDRDIHPSMPPLLSYLVGIEVGEEGGTHTYVYVNTHVYIYIYPSPTPYLVGIEVGEEGGDRLAVLVLGGVEGGDDRALDDLVVEVRAGQLCVYMEVCRGACIGLKANEMAKMIDGNVEIFVVQF